MAEGYPSKKKKQQRQVGVDIVNQVYFTFAGDPYRRRASILQPQGRCRAQQVLRLIPAHPDCPRSLIFSCKYYTYISMHTTVQQCI